MSKYSTEPHNEAFVPENNRVETDPQNFSREESPSSNVLVDQTASWINGREKIVWVLFLIVVGGIGIWYLVSLLIAQKSVPLLVEIGSLYQSSGKTQDAVRVLDEAVSVGINDPVLLGRVGELYRLVREYDKSIDMLMSALNSDPSNETYLLSLARSYAGAGRCQLAHQEYQKLILLRPDNFTYVTGLVACFRVNGEYESALAELDRYIALVPNDYQAYQLKGDLYRDQQKWEESILVYQDAVEMNPEAYTSYINMGLSYTNQRDYNAARINFQEAARIYPNRAEPYYYFAETYIGEGKFEDAIPFYEKSLKVDDTYALAQMGLGKAYAAMNDCTAAIPYFQDALISSPGNIDATQGLTNCSISP